MRAISLASAAFAACCLTPAAAAQPAAYAVVDRIVLGDGGWDFANVDAASGQLYIARKQAITAIDLATRKVTNALAPAQGAHQVLALDHGKTLVETDGKSGLTRFIDARNGAILAEVPSGQKPDAAFYDDAHNQVVVMSPGNDTITRIDAASHKVLGQMHLAGGLEFAVADGKGGAYVNLEDAAQIAHIDLATDRVTDTIALPGCTGPTGLASVARGTRLITACANGVALVVDTANAKVIAHLPIGLGPDAVLVDSPRGLAFIPCGASGTLVALSIADGDHIALAQVIATQVSAKTGAIDPRDGRIYLPAATLAAPEPGAKHAKPEPGSFVVLVVAPQG